MYNSRLLFVISLIIFVGGICGREFATRGEAREALVADAMYRSGDWILPRSHSGAFASKPPLLHWIIGGFSSFTEGVTEFTARLPSALAASFFVFCFYLFLLKRFGKEESFISAIILMTSIEWFRAATGARVDLLFSAALCGTLLQMFAWFEEDLKGFKFNLILLLTVAALAKGPAAFVLSGAIFVLFAVAQKRSVFQIVMASMKCFLPALGLSAVWYLIAYQRGGAEFWNLVYEENFARFEGTMDGSPHKHGIGYLLVSIPIGLLPWTIAALPPLISWARSLKSTGNIAPSSFVKFSIISIITTTAFFCIPESKRSVYLLPVYPFFAFLIAQFLLKTRDSTFAWSKTALITFFFALLIAACTCLILVFLGIPDILPLNAEFRAEGQAYLKEIGSLVFGNGFVSQSLLALGFLALVASTIS